MIFNMRNPNEKSVLGKFRKVAGITVAQLADMLGGKVSASSIEKMESHSPKAQRSITPPVAKIISEETNVSAAYLLAGDASKPVVTETGELYEAHMLHDHRRDLAVPDGLSDPKGLLWKRYVEARRRAERKLGSRDVWNRKNKLLKKKLQRDYDLALEAETQKEIKNIPYPRLKRDTEMTALCAAIFLRTSSATPLRAKSLTKVWRKLWKPKA
jgi:transcriptional regulator with XRE-family HTH domain